MFSQVGCSFPDHANLITDSVIVGETNNVGNLSPLFVEEGGTSFPFFSIVNSIRIRNNVTKYFHLELSWCTFLEDESATERCQTETSFIHQICPSDHIDVGRSRPLRYVPEIPIIGYRSYDAGGGDSAINLRFVSLLISEVGKDLNSNRRS